MLSHVPLFAQLPGDALEQLTTRLRRKIEPDPTHPDAIRTVRGVGYIFVPPTG